MRKTKQIAIILPDTLQAAGLQSLLSDYFHPVEISSFPSFDSFTTEGKDNFDGLDSHIGMQAIGGADRDDVDRQAGIEQFAGGREEGHIIRVGANLGAGFVIAKGNQAGSRLARDHLGMALAYMAAAHYGKTYLLSFLFHLLFYFDLANRFMAWCRLPAQ